MEQVPVEQKNRKKWELKSKLRMGAISACSLGIVASLVMLGLIELRFKEVEIKETVFEYTNQAKVGYNVSLLPNKIYAKKTLQEGYVFIWELIDRLNTTFTYDFKASQKARITGSYRVDAVLESAVTKEDSTIRLWLKRYVIQKEKQFSGTDSTVRLTSQNPIQIRDYKKFVENAYEQIKMNFNSKVTLTWTIALEATTDYGTVKEVLTPTMEIPLDGLYAQIGGNLMAQNKGIQDKPKTVVASGYQTNMILACVFAVAALLVLILLLVFTEIAPEEDEGVKRLNRILKNYGDRLVGLSGRMELGEKEIIQVKTIEDLVRTADELSRPILYQLPVEQEPPGFFVAEGEIVYQLIIGGEDSVA